MTPSPRDSPPSAPDASHEADQAQIKKGVAWIGIASGLVAVLDILAIVIILRYFITPAEYGLANNVVWLFPILDMATDLGLSGAVVAKDDHDETKLSTVFWLNLGISLVLFALISLVAPPISGRHGVPILGWMLMAYGSKLIWQNVYFIPNALMKRQLRFGELSKIRIAANVAEFAGKVGFAAAGFGIWCFVLGPLCRVLVTGIGAQLCNPWRPRFVFRLKQAYSYATFGLRTSASQIIFYAYTNVDYPIVQYFFGSTAHGLYKMAYEIALEPAKVISGVVTDVAFPAFARLKFHQDRLRAQFLAFVRANVVTVCTYAAVVVVIVPELLPLVFPKYVGAEAVARTLAIVAVFRAVGYVVPPLLDGIGKPEQTLKYMITSAVLLPTAFVVSARLLGPRLGYEAVAVAWAAAYPIAFVVLMRMGMRAIGLPLAVLLAHIARAFGAIALACAAGFGAHLAARGLPQGAQMAIAGGTVLAVAWLGLTRWAGIQFSKLVDA